MYTLQLVTLCPFPEILQSSNVIISPLTPTSPAPSLTPPPLPGSILHLEVVEAGSPTILNLIYHLASVVYH